MRLIFIFAFLLIGGTIHQQVYHVQNPWSHITVESGLPDNDVRSILRDKSGALWFGTRNGGIASFTGQDSTWTYFTADDGLSSNGVLSLYQDPAGKIWAAGGAGFSIYDGHRWKKSDSLASLKVRVVYSVTGGSHGKVWMGANGGAGGLDGASWQFFNQDDGLPHRVVHTVHQETEGNLWFACRTGLAYWDGRRMQTFFEELNFRAILRDQAGTMWFGTGGAGILEYNGDTSWTTHLAGKTVLPTLVDRKGHLWAATEGEGAYRYDGETWHHYDTSSGLISDTVFTIAESSDGNILFGTDQGVSIYKQQ